MNPAPLLLTLLGLLSACDDGPEVVRAHNAEDAALNCELLAMASDWYCLPEERTIPLSCSWGDTNFNGSATIEGRTGCVTMTCDIVIRWAEEECLYEQNGRTALLDNATEECCTADDCGVEFGCY
ncbi:hypothetical protein L6R49_02425 [Myxococcota bacterium]|nr:hypothetical protein [Myxococcota bacterium]